MVTSTIDSILRNGRSSERVSCAYICNSAFHHAIIDFANFIGPDTTFYDIHSREQILCYLDTKIKNTEKDPEEKWITTWNDYLNRIKVLKIAKQNDGRIGKDKTMLDEDRRISFCQDYENSQTLSVKIPIDRQMRIK